MDKLDKALKELGDRIKKTQPDLIIYWELVFEALQEERKEVNKRLDLLLAYIKEIKQ